MTRSELSPELTRLVTDHAGRIISCKRSEAGASRITWLIGTTKRRCVLRQDPGDGPVAGTPLTLSREASVFQALAHTSVKIPELLATTDEAILMDMALGSPDLGGLDEEGVSSVMNSYIDALAELHKQEIDDRFAALSPPETPQDAATTNIRLWAKILETKVQRPSALAAYATRWLLQRAPADAEKLALCHGDVGPGNFMHDGSAVTALLDWEFVHVGDPMDDLASLAFRAHHLGGSVGDFFSQLDRWAEKTGLPVSLRRIAYYRISVMYIWLVSCLAALDNGARHLNRFTYLNLITLINIIMPRAMMEYDGLTPPTTPVNLVPVNNDLTESLDALADLIELNWTDSDPGRRTVSPMASQVAEQARLRPDILDQNACAVADLTGELDSDYEQVLQSWLSKNTVDEETILGLLYDNGQRCAAPHATLASIIKKPFLSLDDDSQFS